MKYHQNAIWKKKLFCFDEKPSFCEKFESQIKFCAKGQLISKADWRAIDSPIK